jgi:hypothetical protein
MPGQAPVLLGMKLKRIIWPGASGVLAVLVGLTCAQGGKAAPLTPFIALSRVSAPEIPAEAAELVHAASATDRERTAEEVLQAVSAVARSGVIPFVVSAICRESPELAGPVVAKAIERQPDGVLIFAKAALCAAPGQVKQVVFSACKAAPNSYAEIASIASRQLPAANDLILSGIIGALPALKLDIEEAEIEVGTNDVKAVIGRTVQLSGGR